MNERYDPSNYLYHYTGASAVVGILLNLEFWATDSGFLNDRLERELVDQELSGMANNPLFVHTGKMPITPQLREAVRNHLRQGGNYSILSFSKHGNSLTQFRMYCPPGGGYVLGFTPDYLRRIGKLVECDYSLENMRAWCLDFFTRFAEAASQLDATADAEAIHRHILSNTSLRQDRIDAGLRFKSDDFKNEDEVRLIISGGRYSIRGVAGDSLLLPYQIVELPDETAEVSIAAGPNADGALAQLSLGHITWLCAKQEKKWEFWQTGSSHPFRIRHPN
jgi:hypothetical protein